MPGHEHVYLDVAKRPDSVYCNQPGPDFITLGRMVCSVWMNIDCVVLGTTFLDCSNVVKYTMPTSSTKCWQYTFLFQFRRSRRVFFTFQWIGIPAPFVFFHWNDGKVLQSKRLTLYCCLSCLQRGNKRATEWCRCQLLYPISVVFISQPKIHRSWTQKIGSNMVCSVYAVFVLFTFGLSGFDHCWLPNGVHCCLDSKGNNSVLWFAFAIAIPWFWL